MKRILVIFLIVTLIIPNINLPLHADSGQELFSNDSILRVIQGLAALFLINRLNNMLSGEDEREDINQRPEIDNREKDIERGIRNLSDKVIMIDPGHGGSDPGAIGSAGLKEKEVALDIGLMLRDYLEKTGADIYMTREKDEFVSLAERVRMANQVNADIFISVHINANKEINRLKWGMEEGIETYAAYNATSDEWSLAWYLQESLSSELRLKNRGLKAANFHVLRNTRNMKSVLLEIGYITNPEEEKFLKNRVNRERAAKAIYEGVLDYYSRK